nr:MAG TPA: hypothetical protein [Caudoviricetes sp.]
MQRGILHKYALAFLFNLHNCASTHFNDILCVR